MPKLLILLLFIIPQLVYSTTFIPVPIKKQIVDSSGVVEGEVLNTESFEDKNGRIITRVFLKADKWIGVKPKHGHLEVYYPGGQVGDRVQKVHGAPSFEMGEKVVLLLKNNEEKNWVQNLALGKYMIKKYGSTNIIINTVYPKHPKVGQMTLESFYSLASRIKESKFEERFKDKYELQVEKNNKSFDSNKIGRKIASVKTYEEKEAENQVSTIWILVLFGALGALFKISRRKHSD